MFSEPPAGARTGFSEPDNAPFDLDDAARREVAEALGPVPVTIDEIIRITGLSARAVTIVLTELDLAGRLEREGRHRVALRLDSPL